MEESFEFIARFFENSIAELQARNSDIEGSFRRKAVDVFSAVVYRNGKAEARCSIRLGERHSMLGGITYSHNDDGVGNSYNEALHVEKGEQELFLKAMGIGRLGGGKLDHLSQEGGAEYFWSLFVEPLQR